MVLLDGHMSVTSFQMKRMNVNLTAGVTYLFLIDDENTSPSSGTITVGCPCIPPPGGIDESITVTSNTSYSSTTIGACNDCSLRSSNDRVLEVVIPCAGTYTFTTCNLSNLGYISIFNNCTMWWFYHRP